MANEVRRFPRGLVWGILILAFGTILLLDQMGLASADAVFRFFWPGVFLFFGVELIARHCGSARIWGVFLTAFGALLLLNSFGIVHVSFAIVWPLAIIFWGLWMVAQAFGRGPRSNSEWVNNFVGHFKIDGNFESSEFQPESVAIFSAIKRRIVAKDFKGGKITAVFGGFEIDLTGAELAADETVLEVSAVFGGGEIFVPETWLVSVQGAAIFGEYADKTRHGPSPSSGAKKLLIKGAAVFGSVVVKN
ncbi:MAG: DUF5668 domain-containing protein [Candidatus Acidiferrales bacterium]